MTIDAVLNQTNRGMGLHNIALAWSLLLAIPSALELPREACAIGVAALTIVPLVLSWIQRRRLLVADPIIVLGLVWMLAVTTPVLLPHLYKDRTWFELSSWSIDEAARWMFRGWAAACVSYWAGRVLIRKPLVRTPTVYDLQIQVLMRRLIGVLGTVGALLFVVATGGKTYQILEAAAVSDSTGLQIVHLLKEMSYAYVFLYFFDKGQGKKLFRIDKLLMAAVLSTQAILFIGSGTKYAIIVLGASWILGNATSAVRPGIWKELKIATLGIVAIFSISYIVAAYRGELVSRPLPPESAPISDVVTFQFEVMGDAVTTIVQGREIGRGYYTNYDNSFVLDRFAHLSGFAVFMEFISFKSPYENSVESIIAPVFAVIPSVLVPNKVHFFGTGDFAKMYGWSYGGLSISTPGSFFWAWGFPGIIMGMAGMGWIIAWLWKHSFELNSSAFIWRTVMVMSVVALLDVGVTFQTVVIPATRVLILLWLLRWGLRVWLNAGRG